MTCSRHGRYIYHPFFIVKPKRNQTCAQVYVVACENIKSGQMTEW